MIGDHARHHGLADRHRTNPDAGIMAALGADLGVSSVTIDGAAGGQDRRSRLDHKTAHDRLPGRNAAQDAARMVRQKGQSAVVAHAHFIGILFAAERRRGKARADLDALDGVNTHERRGEIAVELAIDRCAEARRNAFRHHLDDRPYGGATLADVVEVALEETDLLRIRTEERIALHLVPVPTRTLDLMWPHLDQRPAHGHPWHDLARDRSGGNTGRGLARGLPTAAAIVADAVFGIVGEVRMPRPVLVLDVGIILGALIDVVDHQRDWRSGRYLLAGSLIEKHAGEDFHLIRLAP